MAENIFIKLREAGISSLPVNSEKKPMLETWKFLQERLPSIAECEKFNNKNKYGVGVVCGAVSGNLEVIDIDNKNGIATEIFEDICKQITNNRIDLFDKLVIEKSIRNGYHLIYRCDKIEGSRKLARQKNEDGEIFADIETRGEGSYCVVYPTPGYERIQKNILKVEKISVEDRDFLFELCLMFNKYVEEKPTFINFKQAFSEKSGDRIGDFYNERNDFIDILKKHNWEIEKEESDKIHFRRPGKNKGNSATFLFEPRLFYVFSSNAYPFEEQKSYSPFAIFTLLECNGDFNESPKKLAELYPEFDKNNKKNNKKVQNNDKNTDNKEQNEHKTDKKYDLFEFWQYKNSANKEIVIKIGLVVNFLINNNIYCYYKDKDIYYIVKEENNIIEKLSDKAVLKFLQNFIDELPDDYCYDNNNNFGKDAIKLLLNELSVQQFNKIIQNLQIREIEFLKDDAGVCYKCFKNCVVKLTPTNFEIIEYQNLDKKVWKANIIDFNFTYDDNYENSIAFKFHEKVCTSKDIYGKKYIDWERFAALRSALGYLMYNYKTGIDNKAIIFCEEQVSDSGGRTGKTLTCKMLKEMGCNLARINGRNVDFSNRFLFQNVDFNTNIIQFDDTDAKFDFGGLYSIITDGITIEKKNKPAIELSHHETPKFVITTNQVLTDESNSGKGRKLEIEFSDYFNDEYTPFDEFKCIFFDDWDEKEWNKFYNYMISNILLYLQEGLISYKSKNLTNRKLLQAIDDDDLLEFCDKVCLEILSKKKNMSNKEIFELFKATYNLDNEQNKYDQAKITRAMKKFISIKNLKAIKGTLFRHNNKVTRGFIYVPENFESKKVQEFLEDHKVDLENFDKEKESEIVFKEEKTSPF